MRTGLNIIILYVNQPSVLSAAFFTLSTRAAQLAALSMKPADPQKLLISVKSLKKIATKMQ